MKARRASYVIVFGEGDERWSFPDPGHPIVHRAHYRARYDRALNAPRKEVEHDARVLADVVSALAYLLYTCPSSKLACEKLRALRRAVRDMPPPEDT